MPARCVAGGGPGGWWILAQPGVTVSGSPEFYLGVAGARRGRMPELPEVRVDVVPDWTCEVLSPSTRSYDLTVKRRFYARIGVAFLWYVDLEARTLVVSRLVDGRWGELGWSTSDGGAIRAEPFDDVEIDLAAWWGG